MKIYCAHREYENEFDKYLGKDMWIEMRYLSHNYWVKLLRKEVKSLYPGVPPHEVYIGNAIWSHTRCPEVHFQSLINHESYIDIDLYHILEPIEIRTTQELHDMMVEI